MTYREAKKVCAAKLADAKIENETAESGFLLEAACDMTRSSYLLYQMDEMPQDQFERYMEWTEKRCAHIPLQYLTGEQEFMGLDFHVNEHVLIPRQDTEILVEEALKKLEGRISPKVLDLCTGSGCIAVSIKYYKKDAVVDASDISPGALKTAVENASENHTDIRFLRSDLFSEIRGKYDMIVSNPPYIPTDVIQTLMPEVREHEPIGALDGTEDGLEFYRRIIAKSGDFLNQGGWILFEIGSDQGEAVSELLKKQGFADIKVIPDLAGLDRVVTGRRL